MNRQSVSAWVAAAAAAIAIAGLPCVAAAEDAPQSQPAAELTLTKLTFARKIEQRQPVDEVQRAPADDGRVYAYVELVSKSAGGQIALEWAREGKVRYRHALKIGTGKTWRTWGFIKARKATVGEWTVTVRDDKGGELGSKQLVIEGGAAAAH